LLSSRRMEKQQKTQKSEQVAECVCVRFFCGVGYEGKITRARDMQLRVCACGSGCTPQIKAIRFRSQQHNITTSNHNITSSLHHNNNNNECAEK
jgi:hypothetical protein